MNPNHKHVSERRWTTQHVLLVQPMKTMYSVTFLLTVNHNSVLKITEFNDRNFEDIG